MPFTLRTSAALLCIAVAVFTTVLSAVVFEAPTLVLSAAWQIVPAAGAVVILAGEPHGNEQTGAVLALALSRPPPRTSSHV